jgi:Flp pilus assembly protein TadD
MARAPARSAAKRPAGSRQRAPRAKPGTATGPVAPPPAARRPRVSLPSLESGSTRLRKVILNIAFVLAILIFIPVLASQFLRNPVLIEPISVPKALQQRGLTPEVVANRLWDGLRDATILARTSKASVDAIPDSQRVQFSVPEVGLSMDSIVRQARQFFNIYQTRIAGEFICADTACTPEGMRLRLRVMRGSSEVIDLPPMGSQDTRAYFTAAATEVLQTLDPFVAIAAISATEPMRAVTMARRLIRQHHPDAKWAYMLIGNIRSEHGDDRAAWPEYQAAVALDPKFAVARANLAGVLRRLGDPVAARRIYDELAAEQPDSAKPYEGYGELAAAAGDTDGAIALFEKAAELDPTSAHYFSRIGMLEQARGNMDAARDWFRRALAIDPAHILATTALLRDYLSQGDFAGALPMLRAASQHAPGDALAQGTYAFALMLTDQPGPALEAFERALMVTPDDPEILFEAGKLLLALDRVPEALARLDRAIALDPYNPAPLMSRGTALAVAGQNEAARHDFERIIEVDQTGLYAPQATAFLDILDGLEAAAAEARESAP